MPRNPFHHGVTYIQEGVLGQKTDYSNVIFGGAVLALVAVVVVGSVLLSKSPRKQIEKGGRSFPKWSLGPPTN